jgi:hypothetical protein
VCRIRRRDGAINLGVAIREMVGFA